MPGPKITVLMAVHNGAAYLDACVASILAQTVDDFEFLCYDDASTDGSLLILRRWAARDRRFAVIQNDTNRGLTWCLNDGLERARGDLVARMDADDVAFPKRFEVQCDFLEKHPEVFLCGASSEIIDENGARRGELHSPETPAEIAATLPERNCMQHPTILFYNHREVYYREKYRYAQDYDLFLRLLSSGRPLGNVPAILQQYRVAPDSISCAKRAQQILFAEKAREFHEQRCERGDDEYDNWNPATILEFDVETATDARILLAEMHAAMASRRFADARRFLARYFVHHGAFNRYPVYWLWSWFRQKCVPGFSLSQAMSGRTKDGRQ